MKQSQLILALIFLATAALLLGSSIAQEPAELSIAPVSVFFTRHAETEASTQSNHNPELSEAGVARSHALRDLLKESGATHLFASEYQRTQGTLASLAKELKLDIVVISARDGKKQLETLRALPAGSVAIVCGHSNTVPAMVIGLGGVIPDFKDLPSAKQIIHHDTYNRLFFVTLPTNKETAAKAVELRYGVAVL